MNALVKVVKNGHDFGVCGIYNGFTQEQIMQKFEINKKDYFKYEKSKGTVLELYIDDNLVDKYEVPVKLNRIDFVEPLDNSL